MFRFHVHFRVSQYHFFDLGDRSLLEREIDLPASEGRLVGDLVQDG